MGFSDVKEPELHRSTSRFHQPVEPKLVEGRVV
jgi:hypothetical protein